MITLKAMPNMRLAALVERAPNITFHGVWKNLHSEAGKQNLIGANSIVLATFRASALDGPASMQTYSAALTVSAEAAVAAPFEEIQVPAGQYASFEHKGSYDGLPSAWNSFVTELASGAHKPDLSRPCFEIYRNDPRATPVADLITELCVPV